MSDSQQIFMYTMTRTPGISAKVDRKTVIWVGY
jgi:hypothetical protein